MAGHAAVLLVPMEPAAGSRARAAGGAHSCQNSGKVACSTPEAQAAATLCAAQVPVRWGALSAHGAPRYGAWHLRARDWQVEVGPPVSTWERPVSHLDCHAAAAPEARAALAAAGGGSAVLGPPSPTDAWTGRRQDSAAAAAAAAALPTRGVSPGSGPRLPSGAGRSRRSGSTPGSRGGTAATATAAAAGVAAEGAQARADSAAATARLAEHARTEQRAARARARLQRRLAGSYGLKAYKAFMRDHGFRETPSLACMSTPTEEDVREWEAREQRRRDRAARHAAREGAGAAEAAAAAADSEAESAANATIERPSSARSSAGSTSGKDDSEGPPPCASDSSMARASGGASPRAAPRARPPGVPRLALGALIAQAAAAGGSSGAASGRGASAVAAAAAAVDGGGGAPEQLPLAREDAATLEALFTGRLSPRGATQRRGQREAPPCGAKGPASLRAQEPERQPAGGGGSGAGPWSSCLACGAGKEQAALCWEPGRLSSSLGAHRLSTASGSWAGGDGAHESLPPDATARGVRLSSSSGGGSGLARSTRPARSSSGSGGVNGGGGVAPVVDWGSGRRMEDDSAALARLLGTLDPAPGGSNTARAAGPAPAPGAGRPDATALSSRARRVAALGGGFSGPVAFTLAPRRRAG
jgi:hypothetical protein